MSFALDMQSPFFTQVPDDEKQIWFNTYGSWPEAIRQWEEQSGYRASQVPQAYQEARSPWQDPVDGIWHYQNVNGGETLRAPDDPLPYTNSVPLLSGGVPYEGYVPPPPLAGAGNPYAGRTPPWLQANPAQQNPLGTARFGPSMYWADSVRVPAGKTVASRDRNYIRFTDGTEMRVPDNDPLYGPDGRIKDVQQLQANQGGRRFVSANGQDMQGKFAPLADYFLRSDTPSGITSEPIPQDMLNLLDEALRTGVLKENTGAGAGAGAGSGNAAPPGGSTTTLITPEMTNALAGKMNQAASGAVAESNLRGIVMRPVFAKDGSQQWTYEPVLDAQGKTIPTKAGQLTDAQIAEIGARSALASYTAAGKMPDPSDPTGKTWIELPAALLQKSQAGLNDAQAKYQLAKINIEQSDLDLRQADMLAKASQDPNRIVEAANLARLYGASRGAQAPLPSAYTTKPSGETPMTQFTMGPASYGQAYGPNATTLAGTPGQQAQATQAQTPVGYTWQGPYAGQNAGAPTGNVQLPQTTPAAYSGWYTPNEAVYAQTQVQPGQEGQASLSAMRDRAQLLGAQGVGAAENQQVTASQGMPAAYQQYNTGIGAQGAPTSAGAFALSPEIMRYLSGGTVPQFGDIQGTQGQMVTVDQLRNSGWNARQTPWAYGNLSKTGKTELGAINLAVKGQRPEDLEQEIKNQLPGGGTSSGKMQMPAAYSW